MGSEMARSVNGDRRDAMPGATREGAMPDMLDPGEPLVLSCDNPRVVRDVRLPPERYKPAGNNARKCRTCPTLIALDEAGYAPVRCPRCAARKWERDEARRERRRKERAGE